MLLFFLAVCIERSIILGKARIIDLSDSIIPTCGSCCKDFGYPLILPHLREQSGQDLIAA